MIFDTTSNQLWIDTTNGNYNSNASSTANISKSVRNLSVIKSPIIYSILSITRLEKSMDTWALRSLLLLH